jgi:hypothetical protein
VNHNVFQYKHGRVITAGRLSTKFAAFSDRVDRIPRQILGGCQQPLDIGN